MKARFICSFIFLMVLLDVRAQGILIKPAKLEFTVDKGQAATQTLFLQNNLGNKIQFKVYLGDWLRDTTGGHQYMLPGTNGFSCAPWIKLDQEFVELAPGESRTIVVKLTVPDSITAIDRMRWAMVFVETTEEAMSPTGAKGLQAGVNKVMRMGIHVYETPPSVVAKDMRMLSFDRLPVDTANKYRIVCQNTGSVQIECKSYLELMNLSSGIKTKLEFPEFPMFPGQRRFVDYQIPASLPKGKYQVIAAVDAGEDIPLEAAQKTIEIR